ncbi:caspase family protein [Streptomyces sp. KL116D]|uniref:caspase family protein n=1 Tax=Streptomyces sp. KL116D TaxID=3045152 RepID=UPI003557A640
MTTDPPRRLLVVAGTARYDEEALPDLPCVESDLATVTEALRTLGYPRAERLLDPTAQELRKELAVWARECEAGADDVLVLYYTGHGERDDRQHYLMCRDSEGDQLRASAVPSDQVVGILAENGFTRLLLIIDTCYAGQGAVDTVRSLANALLASPAIDEHRLTDFSVIASTRGQDLAQDGAFAPALRAALEDRLLGGSHQPKLHLEAVVDRVNDILVTTASGPGPAQEAVLATLAGGSGPGFLPNPRYVPSIPARLDLAEQQVWLASPEARRRHAERLQHFAPRGRGTDTHSGTASYFTGRRAALAELTDWLDDRSPGLGRCVLVTGGPGVGKSSLLGRLVLLADPAARAGLDDLDPRVAPPARPLHTAIHARHKLLEDIVAAVADAAGMPGAEGPEVLAALAVRSTPLAVVVDALDEAGTAGTDEEALHIARGFLGELAALPCVRLLVGARPHLAAALGPAFTRLDLDDTRWLGGEDVALYARKLLLAPDGEGSSSPHTDDSATRTLARAVAERAGDNYLCARLLARHLARPTTDARDWMAKLTPRGPQQGRDRLPDEERAALGLILSRVMDERLADDPALGRALLTALAFAEGTGLPSNEVWRAAAGAVLGAPVAVDDVRRLLERGGEFIVESTDPDERSVYRLYHESFAEVLRERAGGDTAERIARALHALVPVLADGDPGPRDWRGADPYLTAHLATHATAVPGLLDCLAVDPQYLLTAEPVALGRVLPEVTQAPARAARAAYLRCAPLLAAEPDEGHRAAQLHMSAVQEAATGLRTAIEDRYGHRLPWKTLWARAAPAPYRAVGPFDAPVVSLAVVPVDGPDGSRTAIVAVDETGRIEVRDFATGEHLHDLSGPRTGRARALHGFGEYGRAWVAVVSGSENAGQDTEQRAAQVRVVDAGTGVPVGPDLPVSPVAPGALAVAEAGGTCVVAVAEQTAVRLIDARTGRVVARLEGLSGPRSGTYRLAAGPDGHGRLTVAAATGRETYETSLLRPRNARMRTWTVDPRDGWAVRRVRQATSRGNVVLGVSVVRGQAQVPTSVGYRRGDLRTKDARLVHADELVEWWSPMDRHDRRSYSPAADGMRTVDFHGGEVTVSGTDRTATFNVGGSLRAATLGPDHAGLPALVTASQGPYVRIWTVGDEDTRPPEADEAWGRHGVAARTAAGTVLGRSGADRAFYHAFTGERLPRARSSKYWLAESSGSDLPPVTYQRASSRGLAHSVEVWEAEQPRTVTLHGTRGRYLWNLRTASWAGRAVLVGYAGSTVSLWDLDGHRIASWRVGWFTPDRLRAAESAGHLYIGVPGSDKQGGPILRHPRDDATQWRPGAHLVASADWDLGTWQGAPAAAFLVGDRHLLVQDLTDPGRNWVWPCPDGSRAQLLRFAGTAEQDLVVMVSADERLVFFAPDRPDPVASVHMAAEIQSVVPVQGRLLGVATANGLFGISLDLADGGPR